MQLVACSNCHAQYDVSTVITDTLTCRCGETIENRPLKPVDASIHRCGSCGAQIGSESLSCDYCGSNVVRDPEALSLICPECYARNAEDARFCTACGVNFDPEPLPANVPELPCPACGALMPGSQVGGVAMNECGGCHGLWVPGENFDRLVSRAAEARREAGSEEAPPRVTGSNPATQRVQYRKCPACDGLMHRRNYRRSSGVILDVCKQHGTFLDPDELEQIAGFIMSGGQTSPTLRDEHEKVRREVASARPVARVDYDLFRSHDRQSDWAGGLLGLLTRILTS